MLYKLNEGIVETYTVKPCLEKYEIATLNMEDDYSSNLTLSGLIENNTISIVNKQQQFNKH